MLFTRIAAVGDANLQNTTIHHSRARRHSLHSIVTIHRNRSCIACQLQSSHLNLNASLNQLSPILHSIDRHRSPHRASRITRVAALRIQRITHTMHMPFSSHIALFSWMSHCVSHIVHRACIHCSFSIHFHCSSRIVMSFQGVFMRRVMPVMRDARHDAWSCGRCHAVAMMRGRGRGDAWP